jgi:hypothetical protein
MPDSLCKSLKAAARAPWPGHGCRLHLRWAPWLSSYCGTATRRCYRFDRECVRAPAA